MTDDMISRAAALAECQKISDDAKSYSLPQMAGGANACREAIRALPAVAASQTPDPVVKADRQQSVRVKPLRFIEADGLDIDHMRERARQDPLSREGDMRLVWVNEGDLYSHTIFLAAIETQPDPRDAVIAQLVEAIGSAVKWTDQYRWSAPWTDDARAALSAAKGGAA